jgi:hypothetical protein
MHSFAALSAMELVEPPGEAGGMHSFAALSTMELVEPPREAGGVHSFAALVGGLAWVFGGPPFPLLAQGGGGDSVVGVRRVELKGPELEGARKLRGILMERSNRSKDTTRSAQSER